MVNYGLLASVVNDIRVLFEDPVLAHDAVLDWVNRRQQAVVDYLIEENRVLREQLHCRRLRFTDDQRRRLASKGRLLARRVLDSLNTIVTPNTILRWYRELVAKKYDGTRRRRPARPPTTTRVRQLIVRFATENPGWGYTRIRGALRNLGHDVGRNTIKRVLREHGMEPAPARRERMPWATFLKAHLGVLGAMDFFTVEVLTLAGLVRYSVLFVIDVATRRVTSPAWPARPMVVGCSRSRAT